MYRRVVDAASALADGYILACRRRSTAMEPYQIRDLAEMIILSGTFLASLFMITRVFISRHSRIGKADLKQLVDSINSLRESVDGMRVDMGDVTERLDFTERVLGRMAEEKKLERGATP